MKRLSAYLIAALALASASCSSNDSYSPGAAKAEGSVDAYFDAGNTFAYTLSPDDEKKLTLTLSRRDSVNEATVAINVVSCDTSAIVIPSTVTFAAGKAQTELTITCDGLQEKKEYGFTLTVDEANADHYTIQNGATRFEGSVIVSVWKKLKNVKFYYSGTEGLPTTYSDLYQLEGVNKFYLTDFLGSGTSLYFTVGGSDFKLPSSENANDTLPSGGGELIPDEGCVYTEDYTSYKLYTYYLGADQNGNDLWGWTTGGVTYEAFYWYGGSDSYSYISFDDKYIYMSAYPSTNVVANYVSLYGVW